MIICPVWLCIYYRTHPFKYQINGENLADLCLCQFQLNFLTWLLLLLYVNNVDANKSIAIVVLTEIKIQIKNLQRYYILI